MLTTRRDSTLDVHELTPRERDWIRRQGRAACMLEARQRRALRARRGAPRRAKRT